MNKNDFLNSGLVEQYVLGLTDEEETQLVETYLQRYPDLKKQVSSMQTGMMKYARAYTREAVPGIQPSMTKVPGFEHASHTHTRKIKLIVSLGVALLLVLAVLFVRQDSAEYPLFSVFFFKNQELATPAVSQDRATFSEEQFISLTTHPSTLPIVLEGTLKNPDCNGIIYYNEGTRQCFLKLLRFPAPPKSRQYQVWADINGRMEDAGLIPHPIDRIHQLKFIKDAVAFNITLEPLGGSPLPDLSDLYAFGPVKR